MVGNYVCLFFLTFLFHLHFYLWTWKWDFMHRALIMKLEIFRGRFGDPCVVRERDWEKASKPPKHSPYWNLSWNGFFGIVNLVKLIFGFIWIHRNAILRYRLCLEFPMYWYFFLQTLKKKQLTLEVYQYVINSFVKTISNVLDWILIRDVEFF